MHWDSSCQTRSCSSGRATHHHPPPSDWTLAHLAVIALNSGRVHLSFFVSGATSNARLSYFLTLSGLPPSVSMLV